MNPYLITRAPADFNNQVNIKTFKERNNELLGWAYYAPRFVLEFLEPMMQEWFEKYILDNFTEAERAMYDSIWYSDWWSDGVQSEEERRKLIDKQVIFMYEYYQWCKATIAREFPKVYTAMYYRWRNIDQKTKEEYMHWPSYDTYNGLTKSVNRRHTEHKSLDKFIPGRLLFEGQIQAPNTWGHLKRYYEQDTNENKPYLRPMNVFLWHHLWKPESVLQNQLMKISEKARKEWNPEFYKHEDLYSLWEAKQKPRQQPAWQEWKDMRYG